MSGSLVARSPADRFLDLAMAGGNTFLTGPAGSGKSYQVREFLKRVRKWRADFAHLPSRTLIEIEGGIYVNGRHNRGAGFAADLEKYLEASLAGWRVVRLGPNELTSEHIARLVALVQSG